MKQIDLKNFKSLEEMAHALDSFDAPTLRETLAYILKIYIVDRELTYDGAVSEDSARPETMLRGTGQRVSAGDAANFAELVSELKRNNSFPELQLFSVEGGQVYVTVDGKKHVLSAKASSPKTPEPARKAHETKQQGKNTGSESPGRFKNLEMD